MLFKKPKLPEVGVIAFPHGKLYLHYEPQSDITAIELAHLIPLFSLGAAKMAQNFIPAVDYYQYILDKGLERHFAIKETLENKYERL